VLGFTIEAFSWPWEEGSFIKEIGELDATSTPLDVALKGGDLWLGTIKCIGFHTYKEQKSVSGMTRINIRPDRQLVILEIENIGILLSTSSA
jgi:hypothetical protein